jgi:energy-coupling factor transporter ATP-binding protein EcfA2
VESSSQTTTSLTSNKQKRRFCANGRAYENESFFVDPTDELKKYPLAELKQGRFLILSAPSQSGKTTRLAVLEKIINDQEDLITFNIDMVLVCKRAVTLHCSLSEAVMDVIQDILREKSKQYVKIIEPTLDAMFLNHNASKYFAKKKVILLLDEFNVLDKCNEEERDDFLGLLWSIKQKKEQYQLLSVLAYTNFTGSYLNGANMTVKYDQLHWNREQVGNLFAQYIDQEKIELNVRVIDIIFRETAGAPGLTAMYGAALELWRQDNGHPPSLPEWTRYISSKAFFDSIKSHTNYERMGNLLLAHPEILTKLGVAFLNDAKGDILRREEEELLQRANLVAVPKIGFVSYKFANPFAKALLISLYEARKVKAYKHKLMDDGKLDFLDLVKCTLENMAPTDLIFHDRHKENKACSQCTPGYNEANYRATFAKVLERIIEDVSRFSTEEVPVTHPERKTLSCNSVYTVYGHRIAVEHGVNLSLARSASFNTTGSVNYHYFQAVEYEKYLQPKCEQTWLIIWTTRPPGKHGDTNNHNQEEYYFPAQQDSNVRTIYIYHDAIFLKVEIYTTQTDCISFNIPPPVWPRSCDEPCAKKQRTGLETSKPTTVRVVITSSCTNEQQVVSVSKNWTVESLKEEICRRFKVDAVANIFFKKLPVDDDVISELLREDDELKIE